MSPMDVIGPENVIHEVKGDDGLVPSSSEITLPENRQALERLTDDDQSQL
jgi:hypothetical protein